PRRRALTPALGPVGAPSPAPSCAWCLFRAGAATRIYALSLHDALPICRHYEALERLPESFIVMGDAACAFNPVFGQGMAVSAMRSEEHTSELQSREKLVCRLLLEKNNKP